MDNMTNEDNKDKDLFEELFDQIEAMLTSIDK